MIDLSNIWAFDTETFPIGEGECPPAPDLVCLSYAYGKDRGLLSANHDPVEAVFSKALGSDVIMVAQRASYDLTVLVRRYPALLPLVMDKIRREQITCTQIRAKLINLHLRGVVDHFYTPDGSKRHISYSLETQMRERFGVDRSEDKKGDDAPRLHYGLYADTPVSGYPEDFRRYAIQDSEDVLRIYADQAESCVPLGNVEYFRTGVDFVLRQMTCRGIATDQELVAEIRKHLSEELSEERLAPLFESGIVIPASPPQPYKNGAKAHVPECTGAARKTCECPVKLKAAVAEKLSTKALAEHVLETFPPEVIRYTEPSSKYPQGQLQVDRAWTDEVSGFDALVDLYAHRAGLQKLVTTELPVLENPFVYPNFSVLKKTGRTGSNGDKNYPSRNIQNPHKITRPCYRARDGYVLCSSDFDFLELCSLADKCVEVVGWSALADAINAGKDPHAYLGAQLGSNLNKDFRVACHGFSKEARYDAFRAMEDHSSSLVAEFYGHYRWFAKPTGLGYPGMLGPDTFIEYAKAVFGIEGIDRAMAVRMRDIWHECYPEMEHFFDWVKTRLIQADGTYSYWSKMGMLRSDCTITQASNGAGMQTDSAEGALLALYLVYTKCVDRKSILFGCHPLVFMHDEIILEVPITTPDLMHAQAYEFSRLMRVGMDHQLKHVRSGASPVFMRNWDKAAKAVFDEDGYLKVWTN